MEEKRKRGRPRTCVCDEPDCHKCGRRQRRIAADAAQQAGADELVGKPPPPEASWIPPERQLAEPSVPLSAPAAVAEPAKSTEEYSASGDIHETKEHIAPPDIDGEVDDDFDFDGLAPPPPDPEEEQAKAEAADFEERVERAGPIHQMIGQAAKAIFMQCMATAAENGIAVPDFEFNGVVLPGGTMVGHAGDVCAGSWTRLAVKYLPDDLRKPALYDEIVGVGTLVGAIGLASYSVKTASAAAPTETEPEIDETEDEQWSGSIDVPSAEKREAGPAGMIREDE